MSQLTLTGLSKKMRDIDFAMLTTRTASGDLAGRPMSNNGEVDYDGDSYFFSYDDARTIADIEQEPRVSLALQGAKGLLGAPPLFIAVEGRAELVRDKAAFADHWSADLDRWFPEGVDTPGLVMIAVHASRIHYWQGEEEGEILV
jgi:general stress protein 26